MTKIPFSEQSGAVENAYCDGTYLVLQMGTLKYSPVSRRDAVQFKMECSLPLTFRPAFLPFLRHSLPGSMILKEGPDASKYIPCAGTTP
jgi:hypothetical protein